MKLAVGVEVRLMIRERLKCLCESFQPSKEVNNCDLSPIPFFTEKKNEKRKKDKSEITKLCADCRDFKFFLSKPRKKDNFYQVFLHH